MAELWQAYGSWVLYALFFLVFLWLHGFMHGGIGHQRSPGPPGGDPGAHAGHTPQPGATVDAAHGDHAGNQTPHKHGGGCC